MEVAEAVDGIRRAFRELRVAREQPALLANAWESVGDCDRVFELLDCAEDQDAVSPRAVVRNVKMVATRLGL